MTTVVVVGATSGIGEAIGRELASAGFDLVLAGRERTRLEASARDLETRFGIRAGVQTFEALEFDAHDTWTEKCARIAGVPIDGMVLCYGVMEEESVAAADGRIARSMIDVNFSSAVCLLDRMADELKKRGAGFLCAVTSVAGDRGRASNAHYAATKAGLSAYLSGLRGQLAPVGVSVIDVRPGTIDTKLTYGRPSLFLISTPERVAKDTLRGIRRNRAVVYTPGFWRIIMFLIRHLPDFLFRRLGV
ncbi:MAG: SDR family NAD(P)-dependent oxidoreductase [Proteobacteria bacterium]|nr:SDR family NAD(P)-dependent oxidoreductase [Pseudomonadota bacterium]